MRRFVLVANLCASTGGYYYLIVIIITNPSHFTWNVGPFCPFFSLELYTLIQHCSVWGPWRSLAQLVNLQGMGRLQWYGMWAWRESPYSLYIGAIDGNADEVTEVLLYSWWDKNRRTEGSFAKDLCNKEDWNKLFGRICGLIWIFIKTKRVSSLSNIN